MIMEMIYFYFVKGFRKQYFLLLDGFECLTATCLAIVW